MYDLYQDAPPPSVFYETDVQDKRTIKKYPKEISRI